MLDLRLPSGIFFLILGVLLTGLGIFSPAARAPLTPANVNLYTGIVMLAFGAVLFLLSRRGK